MGWSYIAVTEKGVAESFSRVKRDVTTLKRTINREVLKEEEIIRSIYQLTTKDEFYSFVRTLKDKIDSLETSLASKEKVEKHEQAFKEELKELRKELNRIDGLRDELQETKKIKDDVAKLELRTVEKKEFTNDIKDINLQLNELKKDLAKVSKYEKYQAEISELKKTIAVIEKQNASLKDIQSAHKKSADTQDKVLEDIKILNENVSALSDISVLKETYKDDLKAVRVSIAKIETALGLAEAAYVSKKDLSRETESLSKEIATLKKSMNELKGSEIDADELVTKKELTSVLKTGTKEGKSDDFTKIEKKFKEIEQRISSEGKALAEERKLIKDSEQKLDELRSKLMSLSKAHEEKISVLERDVFTALDGQDSHLAKFRNELKEFSKEQDAKIHEVRTDIVLAAKQLIKDLDKRVSDRIKTELEKAQLAPENEFGPEIDEIRKKLEKLDFKGHEKTAQDFQKKLDELEERLVAEIEDTSNKKIKDLESRYTTVDSFSTDLEKRFKKIEERLEKNGLKDFDKKLKNTEEALIAETEELIRETEEKHAARFKQTEEKTIARMKELEAKLKDTEKKLLEHDKLRDEIRKLSIGDSGQLDALRDSQEALRQEQNAVRKEVAELVKLNIRETEKLTSELQKMKEPKKYQKDSKEFADIRKEVDYLLNNVVTTPDMESQLASMEEKMADLRKELKASQTALQKNTELIKRLSAKPEEKTERPVKHEDKNAKKKTEHKEIVEEKSDQPGIFSRIMAGISNFFKDEPAEEEIEVREISEVPKKEEKHEKKEIRHESVKEAKHKEKEERKEEWDRKDEKDTIEEKPGTLKFILIGIIILLAIGAVAYYFLAPPAVEFTPDEVCVLNYECKQRAPNEIWFDCLYDTTEGACRCFVGEYDQCNAAAAAQVAQKQEEARRLPSTIYTLLDYKFYILGIVLIIFLIFYLMTRNPKEKEMEYEDEEEETSLNLDEFLGKPEKKKEKKKGFFTKIKDFFFEEEEKK